MNKAQLERLISRHVKLRPIAMRFDPTTRAQLESLDDRWFVSRVDKARGLSLSLSQTGHGFTLPYDHIREFVSDPAYPGDGFLMLEVQVCLSGDQLWVDPLPPR